jgi:cytidylate kinase
MTARRLVIAIDGPAASGKSSTAVWVARKLKLRHMDSGSFYRAITAARLRDSLRDNDDWSADALLAAASRCGVVDSGVSFEPTIDGELVRTELRSSEVNQNVSAVARVPAVREWVNERVRGVAANQDVVVDGRDIGTAVVPDAPLKIFLVADPWERARRRLAQVLSRAPRNDEIAAETERLVQRDARDAAQSMPARDAVLIDTTHLRHEEQVDRIVALAHAVSGRTRPE